MTDRNFGDGTIKRRDQSGRGGTTAGRWRRVVAIGAAWAAIGAASAHAQEALPPANAETLTAARAEGDPIVYDTAYFARFAPRTAWDMLVQVPGFTIREAGQERGLGEASENVLIDGVRTANKSGGAIRELQRIGADRVLRIEIRDAAGLGIAGLTGQVANVILSRHSAGVGHFEWNPEWRAHYAKPFWFRGQVSYADKVGPVAYTLLVEDHGSRGAFGGPLRLTGPDGSLLEDRDEVLRTGIDFVKFGGQIAVDGPGSSTGNLSIAYTPYWYELTVDEDRRPVGALPFERDLKSVNDGYQFDMSGDIEFRLGPGRLKFIGLRHFDDEPIDTWQTTRYGDGSPEEGVLFVRDSLIGETVLRGEYGWKGRRNTWQISLERAYNSLDQEGSLFELDADGGYDPVDFPGASGKVEEVRYEAIATLSRALSTKLDMQVDGGAEYSELSRDTGEVVTRKFVRPKGSITLGWRPAKAWDFSLKLRRRVGQISFYDFLAQQDLQQDREDSGNPDLVPPQSWELDLEGGWSLGRWGKTRLALWARRIDDIIDIVPIGDEGEAFGNLPRASQFGGRWTGTLDLAAAGIRGAKLDLSASYEKSRVRDPLTGEHRPISGNEWYDASAEFRHDIPQSDIAYGFAMQAERRRAQYYPTEIQDEREGPVFASVFVEHKNVLGMTVRGNVSNVSGARNRWDRTVWDGRRDAHPVLFREAGDRLIGPIFKLLVKGSF